MRWLAYLLAGVIAGILSGIFGIGGGILLIPLLIYLFGFTQYEAQGTTLAVMIPPIGLLAAIEYYRRGYIRLEAVPWIVVGVMAGAYFGALLAPKISEAWLRRLFGLLLCYVGVDFLLTGVSETRFWPAALVTALLGLLFGRFRRSLAQPHDQSHQQGSSPPTP
ncbi:hypothetical protein HRbin36_02756 [bacterium HR36]|nr:hypothetical protein HRbin36_02756 [bacterium HR36]